MPRIRQMALLGLAFLCLVWLPVFGFDVQRMQQAFATRFGPQATTVFKEWQRTLADAARLSEREKLQRVNDFFNQHIDFSDDIVVWGQKDYWATPLELLGQGQGDCEDFSIAKYYSLLSLGVPVSKLRLVYVKARLNAPGGPVLLAHMVLAYYARPNADPLILDNLQGAIKPGWARDDLTPIFSFNSEGLWHGTGNQASRSSLSRWQDLLQRARNEGFQ